MFSNIGAGQAVLMHQTPWARSCRALSREHPNATLLKRGYDAFGKGDMETLRSQVFDANIVWHQIGDNRVSGDYRGAEQMLALFGNIFQLTGGTFRVGLKEIVGTDDLVFGIGVSNGQREGKSVEDEPYCHVARVRDGKMVESWILNLNIDRANEFWS